MTDLIWARSFLTWPHDLWLNDQKWGTRRIVQKFFCFLFFVFPFSLSPKSKETVFSKLILNVNNDIDPVMFLACLLSILLSTSGTSQCLVHTQTVCKTWRQIQTDQLRRAWPRTISSLSIIVQTAVPYILTQDYANGRESLFSWATAVLLSIQFIKNLHALRINWQINLGRLPSCKLCKLYKKRQRDAHCASCMVSMCIQWSRSQLITGAQSDDVNEELSGRGSGHVRTVQGLRLTKRWLKWSDDRFGVQDCNCCMSNVFTYTRNCERYQSGPQGLHEMHVKPVRRIWKRVIDVGK